MLVEAKQQRLYADYHQFHILNQSPLWPIPSARFPGGPPEPELWTRQAFQDRLGAIPGTLGVSTASYGYVQIVIEIHTSEPQLELEPWDHVAEGPLEMKTPDLVITGPLGDSNDLRMVLAPGAYRVRCSYANLAGGTDSGGEGQDWYCVQVWPAPLSPVQVQKRAEQPGAAPVVETAAKPSVSIQPSAGGKTQVRIGPQGLTAQAVSPRHLLSLAYRNAEGVDFPADRMAGPPQLDQGLYDVSVAGRGWQYELKRLLCDQFQWEIQGGISSTGLGDYLFVDEAGTQAKRNAERRHYLSQKSQK